MKNKEILENLPIDQVKPYEKNYLIHDGNVGFIKASIEKFGYNKVSIGIDENSTLLYGHGTLLALKELKFKKIPFVLKISGLTEKQKSAYRIADNECARQGIEFDRNNLKLELDFIGEDFKLEEFGLDLHLLEEEALDPDFCPVSEEEQPRLDKKKEVECPNCGERFEPK